MLRVPRNDLKECHVQGPQRMRGLGPRLWPRAMGSGLEQDRSTSVLTTLSGLDPRVRAGRECLGPRNFGVGFGFTELLRSDVASRRSLRSHPKTTAAICGKFLLWKKLLRLQRFHEGLDWLPLSILIVAHWDDQVRLSRRRCRCPSSRHRPAAPWRAAIRPGERFSNRTSKSWKKGAAFGSAAGSALACRGDGEDGQASSSERRL